LPNSNFKKMKKLILLILIISINISNSFSAFVLLPMDDTQTNHLKAYGLTYWTLQNQVEA